MASKKPAFSIASAAAVTNTTPQKTLIETTAKREYNMQFIPKEKIVPNKKNEKYSQEDIESLKESIRLEGLRHNLCAIFNVENDTYRLVSGERRYRAICALDEKDYKRLFPAGIPVKIEKSNLSEVDEEIILIKANSEKRTETPELKRWEVLRLQELYEIKRKNGEEVPNIAAAISETLGLGVRMTKNYLATQNLIPELVEVLNKKGIAITDAVTVAGLSEDSQKQILNLITETGSVNKSEIEALKKAEAENKELEKELSAAQKSLEEKTARISILEHQMNEYSNPDSHDSSKIQTADDTQNIEEEVAELRREKEFAEKERQKLEDKVKKLQEKQSEREKRNVEISDKELKRLSNLAKLEQTIDSLENEISFLKNNKVLLTEDITLRERTKLIAERLEKILQ